MRNLLLNLLLIVTVAGALASASCKKNETGARERFATKYSCPEDRVEVKARPDVKFGQHTMPPKPAALPPDELKNDPGRLAKWRADQAHSGEAKLREHFDSLDVFEARGCGHEALMACAHPPASGGKGIDTSRVSCTEAPLKPVPAPR